MGSELQCSLLCTKLYNITHALIVWSVKLILTFKNMQKILHLSLNDFKIFRILPCQTKVEPVFKDGSSGRK